MHKWLGCFLIFAAGLTHADTGRDDVLRQILQDGIWLAGAQACKLPNEEIQRQADRQEQATLAMAKAASISLDSSRYRRLVLDSMPIGMDVLLKPTDSTERFDAACQEIRLQSRPNQAMPIKP